MLFINSIVGYDFLKIHLGQSIDKNINILLQFPRNEGGGNFSPGKFFDTLSYQMFLIYPQMVYYNH